MSIRLLSDTDKDALEAIIDRSSLQAILLGLQEICQEKGEHVAPNWQDEKLAAKWQIYANRIARFARGVQL